MTRHPPKVIRRGRPARMLSRAGRPPLCTRLGVFGNAYTAKQIHEPLVDIVVHRAFLLLDSYKGEKTHQC